FANPGTGNGGDAGGTAYTPQLYALSDFGSDKWRFGFAYTQPFGLKTEYQPGWRGQLVALKSEVVAHNVNLATAYRLNEAWSVGAGLNWQSFKTELSQFAGPGGTANLEADDTGLGYNAGVMFSPSDTARIGLSHRSQIAYTLKGNATCSGGGGAADSRAEAKVAVPETVSLTSLALVAPEWEVSATASWTRWSRLNSFDVTRPSST